MIPPAVSDAIDYVSRRARDLVPHPINQEIYGDEPADPRLVESIRKLGVMEAPAILEDGTIISGHRRWRAVMEIDRDTILDCTVLPAFADDLAEQEALVEYNRQREKTFSQRMAEGQLLDRIEYERSKRRQGTRTDIPAKLPEGYEPGETREKVAAKIGMGARTYGKAKKVVEAAEAGDEKAREAVQKIDAGEMSVDRAYKEVTGKASVVIQIFPVVSPTATEWIHEASLNGEMPAVGERALARIRELQARNMLLDRILYNHSLVSVEKLETLVTKAGGTVPSVGVSEPEPVEESVAVVIPPEVLAIGPDEQVTIAAWYLYEGMKNPERTHCYRPPKEGIDAILRMTQFIKNSHPDATFPKFKIDKYEVSREVMEALRPWGEMEEEKEHTVTVYYTNNRVPRVRFFDGVPIAAAAAARSWLETFDRVLTDDTTRLQRIHFADGAGSDMDITHEGLERLAMPAPMAKASGGCCPERRLGKDGRCTGCGTVLQPELLARYLHLLQDEIEAGLQFSRYPYESVMIVDLGGRYAVVVVPPTGDLPEALVEHLMGEAAE